MERESGKDFLRSACVLYGQAIEAILEFELQVTGSTEDRSLSDAMYDAFVIVRPTLFLNLAASNLKLKAAEGALRCCNSAIQLCNIPGLLYSDLAAAEENLCVSHPVAEHMQSLIMKALYRRGKCFESIGNVQRAVEDYRIAESIFPNNPEVKDALLAALKKVATKWDVNGDLNNFESPHLRNNPKKCPGEKKSPCGERSSQTEESVEQMTVNGGRCWMRKAYWSQTVLEASMHISVEALSAQLSKGSNIDERRILDMNSDSTDHLHVDISSCSSSSGSGSSSSRNHGSQYNRALNKWKIFFKNRSVMISNIEENSSTTIFLEHLIISNECTWTMDRDSNILVLHFVKAPSFEWFPGQEVTWIILKFE